MTAGQVTALGPAFDGYLRGFRSAFGRVKSFAHLGTYCRGLASDLPRKSVEPIALAAGTAARTLRLFLTGPAWGQDAVLARLQRRVVEHHLPAPGDPPAADGVGAIGLIDEASRAKEGDETPGVQRQYCGSMGKVEHCIVGVHLAVRRGTFLAVLGADPNVADETWDRDRERCAAAHVPTSVARRSKWVVALEQVERAVANGVRFDWLTFDEGYGGRPGCLALLDGMGLHYCCGLPANLTCWPTHLTCWPTHPTCDSHQRPHQTRRADNVAALGKPFRKQPWRRVEPARRTLAPRAWEVKAGPVRPRRDGQPTDRAYRLIVARNVTTGGVKHLVANAPHAAGDVAEGGLQPLVRRARVPAGHVRGRVRPLRGAELAGAAAAHDLVPGGAVVRRRADRSAAGGNPAGGDDGAGDPGVKRRLPAVARPPSRDGRRGTRGRGDPLPPAAERRRQKVAATVGRAARVAP